MKAPMYNNWKMLNQNNTRLSSNRNKSDDMSYPHKEKSYRIRHSNPSKIRHADGTIETIPNGVSVEEIVRRHENQQMETLYNNFFPDNNYLEDKDGFETGKNQHQISLRKSPESWLQIPVPKEKEEEEIPAPRKELPPDWFTELHATKEIRTRPQQEPLASSLFTSEEELSSFQKKRLEDQLKQLEYLERQQNQQDDFTTKLYGKKNYQQEKQTILARLFGNTEDMLDNTDSPEEPKEYQMQNPSLTENKKEKYLSSPETPFDKRQSKWNEGRNERDLFQWHQDYLNEDKSRPQEEFPQEPNAFERLGIPDPKMPQESNESTTAPTSSFNNQAEGRKPHGGSLDEWNANNQALADNDNLRCNTVFGLELKKAGIDVDINTSMNGIIDGINKSGDWATVPRLENGHLDHTTASTLAQEGYVVAAVQQGGEHGHGAILTGGKDVQSKTWGTSVPEVYASLGGSAPDTSPLSIQWQKKDEDAIDYVVYRDRPENISDKQKNE